MTRVLLLNIADVTEEEYQRLYLQSNFRRKKKADRYLRREDQVRCICAGQLLRFALGADDFEVETNPYGKPSVKNRPDFHYNLTHSGCWVAIAYGNDILGIDVEKIDWNPGKEKLAHRFFTCDEQEYVLRQDNQGTGNRFYEIWTAKEGYLKYLGTGLQKALDSFSVLELESPNRFYFQPEEGYSMTLWTADGAYELQTITVSDLLVKQY
jgi:4'-phosphopantetheinyl transferase